MYLNTVSYSIYKRLLIHKQYGWLSDFVSKQIIDHYAKDFEKKVLTEQLVETTKQRNKLDKEIEALAKKIKCLKN